MVAMPRTGIPVTSHQSLATHNPQNYTCGQLLEKDKIKNFLLQNESKGLIMQTSNSYWWMKHVGESRKAYRRSNTLRYLEGDSTVCGHTLESLIIRAPKV